MKRTVCMILMLAVLLMSIVIAEEPHTHIWGEWQTKTASTCSEDGEKIRICSECGDIDTDSIPATGHNYSDWQTKTEATCSEDGEKVRICNNCGDIETETIPATGSHNYGEWQTKTAATCGEDGEKIRICSECGDIETEDIPATGHNFGDWQIKTEATCSEDGEKVHICSNCGNIETETIPATGSHNYGEWQTKTAATCNKDGEKIRICSECGDIESEDIPATGHSFGEWKTKTEATCTEDGEKIRICSECGDIESDVIPANGNHNYGSYKTIKYPTCASTGTQVRTCSICGKDNTKILSKIAHKYEVTDTVPATDSADGFITYTCTVCGDTYNEVIPMEEKENIDLSECIVFDAEFVPVEYTAQADESGIVMVIETASDEPAVRNLVLTDEQIAQWKDEGIESILFVVNDIRVEIPMSMFEDENAKLLKDDMGEDFVAFAFTVDPFAEDGAKVTTSLKGNDTLFDVTDILNGVVIL